MTINKSDLAPAIEAHFEALKTQHIDVPEWGHDGLPVRIYFDPVTVAERIELNRHDDDFLVMTLIKKAIKTDGSPMFTLADRHMLLHRASSAVVSEIANRILIADRLDPSTTEESSPPGETTGSSLKPSTTSPPTAT